MLSQMNALQVIDEIKSLSDNEKNKVIDFVKVLEQQRYDDEQIRIALARLDDFENGLDEDVSHEEAMKILRSSI
jgi:uncharacterized protein involved in exopolysaccharide biosynthesis